MEVCADTQLDVVARLCAGPPERRSERLALLGVLLAVPASGISAADLARLSPLDEQATRRATAGLKRSGAIEWDPYGQRWQLPSRLRSALTLVHALNAEPAGDEQLVAAQEPLFHLVERELPLAALVAVLADDVELLEDAASAELAEQQRVAGQLGQHLDDAERLLGRLADEEAPSALVGRAVGLVERLAAGVRRLVESLTAASIDVLPRPGTTRSPRELRELVAGLDLHGLALLVGEASPAPRTVAEPPLRHAIARRATTPIEPSPAVAPSAVRAESWPDAASMARGRLHSHQRLSQLLSDAGSWEETLLLHQGALRLHAERIRLGAPGMRPTGTMLERPGPLIARMSEADGLEQLSGAST